MKLRIAENSFNGTRILLTEKSLSRILKDHHVNGYIILSASREYIRKNGDPCKSDDNEMVLLDLITGEIVDESDLITGQRLSAENNKRTADLRKSIISYNLSFSPFSADIDMMMEQSHMKSLLLFSRSTEKEILLSGVLLKKSARNLVRHLIKKAF